MTYLDDAQCQVFGDWDAPVTDGAERIAVPVGETCLWCREEIREGDNGRRYVGGVEHRECALRNAIGGIGHLADHARYCGGELGTDGGLSRRQSSLLAWEWFQETRMEPTPEQTEAWRRRVDAERDGDDAY